MISINQVRYALLATKSFNGFVLVFGFEWNKLQQLWAHYRQGNDEEFYHQRSWIETLKRSFHWLFEALVELKSCYTELEIGKANQWIQSYDHRLIVNGTRSGLKIQCDLQTTFSACFRNNNTAKNSWTQILLTFRFHLVHRCATVQYLMWKLQFWGGPDQLWYIWSVEKIYNI